VDQPEISVVIPTWRRESRLAFALDALAAQCLPAERFETIVVRADGDGEAKTSPPPGLAVRFAVSSTAGAAAQRNHGWRAARAPLVAFLDDDCRPARDWLERLLEAGSDPATLLQGRTEPDADEQHLLHGLARTMEVKELDGWYPTCNIAYPRALLERLDGFDERFPGAYCEDTDLAMRALEHGARAEYVDAAVVWHAVHHRSLRKALVETWRRDVTPIVLKRHPALRESLHLRLFLNWRHSALLLALVGVALRRRWPSASALAVVPYLSRTFDWGYASPRGVVRQAIHFPARLSIDLAEVIVVIRAAIKHRVVML
jgi:GT2 family glycosyltransferase